MDRSLQKLGDGRIQHEINLQFARVGSYQLYWREEIFFMMHMMHLN